ncbi:LPS assembly protein LptD [Blochmannia endosymbiont of Camponotus nipponensis]|uniref:LPS assembly protein LptD n=1 Tax=Blochmannia endosymbiont of Camponotus nipponensis TaxID=2681986 RepID=UPI001F01EAE6|nr:LPS assembly protein LptD [Blochmannia endosymbiont of Camponotus nipponensis]
MYIQSDELEVFYPKKIQFSGHVTMKQNNNILTSDKLIISCNKKNELLYNTLYACGHINYHNKHIVLTGSHAWIDLYNKNVDIHHGTYYLLTPHIYGTANSIMQRKNNRYTIIKEGKCTSCMADDNYWNITGSEMIYDNHKHNIDIWNACLKIKTIPIFYSPYLSLSLHKNNVLRRYIPSIKYSSKYGLIFKIPCPINFSKHYSGSISPFYTSNLGIQLETEIHYSLKPGTGLLILDIINNDKLYNKNFSKNYYNKHWQLYWKHNGIMNKKWHFCSNYISSTGSDNYIEHFNIPAVHTYPHNDHINQKILCNYSNKNWNASLAYFGITNIPTKAVQNNCNYNATPQLELNSYYYTNIKHRPFNLKLFHQLTQFTPTNYYFPKTIRIHTEPTVNFSINDYWGNFNTEAKLIITHYQQKNINHYNTTQCSNYHLQNIVNRIIPQFKINGKMIFKKSTHIPKKYKHFLEPKLQYLYIPYRFQDNIGMYDTDIMHIDHKKLFHENTYSGLDRIFPVNQITGDITMRCFKKKKEIFYASIGHIFNLKQCNSKYCTTTQRTMHKISDNILLFSGLGHWTINDHWKINTEMKYDMQHHALSFGTLILEYKGKNNQILQTNYRYTSKQYLVKILSNINEPIYQNTIAQLGILAGYPLIDHWKINCSYYHNLKTNQTIDQTIGIQYYTPCWDINIACERKIINWNNQLNHNTYDNKIRLDIKIYSSTTDFKSNSYKMLNIGTLPYQHTF